jgi:transcription initiation factor TFIID TATA-box-binding protein
MFSTGKITSIGTRSEREALRSIQATVDSISGVIGSSSFPRPKIENVVAVADTKKHIDFDKMLHLLTGTTYKPRNFAALIYKTNKGTILIFESGKIVCTGAKGEKAAKQAIEKLYKILKKS